MLTITFLKAFLVGGAICFAGQMIIILTHLTNGKLLVLFLVAGAILEGFGLYSKLIEFAGAGASVPISGFGCTLVKGAVEATREEGVLGALTGGLSKCALGIATAIVSGYIIALIFRPHTKKN